MRLIKFSLIAMVLFISACSHGGVDLGGRVIIESGSSSGIGVGVGGGMRF